MIKPTIRKVKGANRYTCSYADRRNVLFTGIGSTKAEAYRDWVKLNRDLPHYLVPAPEPEPEIPKTERILTKVFVGLMICISTLLILNATIGEFLK